MSTRESAQVGYVLLADSNKEGSTVTAVRYFVFTDGHRASTMHKGEEFESNLREN
jgi:hypothetical protein